jgi:hypothetical protein
MTRRWFLPKDPAPTTATRRLATYKRLTFRSQNCESPYINQQQPPNYSCNDPFHADAPFRPDFH